MQITLEQLKKVREVSPGKSNIKVKILDRWFPVNWIVSYDDQIDMNYMSISFLLDNFSDTEADTLYNDIIKLYKKSSNSITYDYGIKYMCIHDLKTLDDYSEIIVSENVDYSPDILLI